jgi:CheY-like chemotaxis protein
MACSPKILCVDDEPSILVTLKAVLEASGFHVFTATSGREALAIFEKEGVDLVLLDYAMPGLSGVATATRMKALKPEIPIAFLSAYRELPGETVGIAEWWARKGEEDPEHLVARLAALAARGRGLGGEAAKATS